jgi:uncharacterized protein DUF1207
MLQLRGGARVVRYALALLAAIVPLAQCSPCAADDRQGPAQTLHEALEGQAGGDSIPPPADDDRSSTSGHIVRLDESPGDTVPMGEYENDWSWQWVPTGLIYHSYMAGPHEPHASLFAFSDVDGGAFADATLGGRMGFLRYGNCDPEHPAGFQLDFYGAAIARLDLENQEDLVACDYAFGFPLTYGNEYWQMKLGYAHVSSHLGDEFAISHPGALNDRANYVRDSIVLGHSFYPIPACRLYGEVGWAFHHDGGAGPWETQFGTEISRPGPIGGHGAPFLAINGRLRDDEGFGGDLNVQTGWLRRGILGQTFRYGFDYYNGKSSQSQFFQTSEHQIGMGLWYDF